MSAVGDFNYDLVQFQTLLSTSTVFQDWVGVDSSDAALPFIILWAVDLTPEDAPEKFVLLYIGPMSLRVTRVAMKGDHFSLEPNFVASFQEKVDESLSVEDQCISIVNAAGNVMADIRSLSGVDGAYSVQEYENVPNDPMLPSEAEGSNGYSEFAVMITGRKRTL